MLKINDYIKWHFVGVGGVSMSKLCAYLHFRGCICTGSDSVDSENLRALKKLGMQVVVGIDADLASKADIVVYNSAIAPSHPERLTAKIAIERKELLGMVESMFKTKIAVAGAHGKTTVSGMLSFIIKDLGLDVMANIGGDIVGLDALNMPKNNDYIVSEACEYARSFLQLAPDISIIVNIDYDHPDCYKDLQDTYIAFAKFLTKTRRVALIDKACHAKLMALSSQQLDSNLSIYTFGETPICDYYSANVVEQQNGYVFNVFKAGENLGSFYIESVNAINVKCATIVIASCHIMGIAMDKVAYSLKKYKGVKRRMELLGDSNALPRIYTDYAHHPKELLSLKENLPKRIIDNAIIVFQPHTYSRTKALLTEFVVALKQFKKIVILPTYPARETPGQGVSAWELYQKLIETGADCEYSQNWHTLKTIIHQQKNTDTILLVGAGIDYMGIFQFLNS